MSLNGVSPDLITPGEIGQSSIDQDHTIDTSAWRFLSATSAQAREHVSGGADDETRRMQERSAITSCSWR
jgi:hypothetical protein